jgi:8-oxo-dGTP pyrophosphatase MutT (NUDIX family)
MAPATPRPAASLILLRRSGRHRQRGVEVLLVRRSPRASFMPGVWVFPGGVVEADETLAPVAEGAPGGVGPAAERALDPEELAHRACAVRELREEAGIELPEEAELHPWSRWITPEAAPMRFDTRFYVALAPPHSPPRPDGAEMTEAAWISPREALARHRSGELSLVFPTIKHLESLLPYETAEQVLEAAPERPIEPVLPRVVADGDARRVVLPGEPGY